MGAPRVEKLNGAHRDFPGILVGQYAPDRNTQKQNVTIKCKKNFHRYCRENNSDEVLSKIVLKRLNRLIITELYFWRGGGKESAFFFFPSERRTTNDRDTVPLVDDDMLIADVIWEDVDRIGGRNSNRIGLMTGVRETRPTRGRGLGCGC